MSAHVTAADVVQDKSILSRGQVRAYHATIHDEVRKRIAVGFSSPITIPAHAHTIAAHSDR